MKALVTGANDSSAGTWSARCSPGASRFAPSSGPARVWKRSAGPPRWRWFRADLRTSRELGRAFEGVDVLLHLAAVVSGGKDEQFAGTIVGTERLLDAMAVGACRRLVLCSSFSVYDYSAVRRDLDGTRPSISRRTSMLATATQSPSGHRSE